MTKEQFKILFDLYFDDIRGYLYYRSGDVLLSTDLAQDTFLRIWEKQLAIDPGKDIGLLYKIAGDLFVSHYRRDKTSAKVMKELVFENRSTSPEEDLQYKELKEKLERTLNSMPEKQRIVFLMSRKEELSYQEIAQRLSISIKTVEKRMSAALALLRRKIKT